jgi:hypothetical protein
MAQTDADRRVIQLATELWDTCAGDIPTDIVRVMRQVGLRAKFGPTPARIRGVLCYQRPPAAAGIIIVSRKICVEELRFTIAHEVIHHAIDAGVIPQCPARLERLCQLGAAHLLMPATRVFADAIALDDADDLLHTLRARYLVSTRAMYYQLRALGLLRPRALWPTPTHELRAAQILHLPGALPSIWRHAWRDRFPPIDSPHQ